MAQAQTKQQPSNAPAQQGSQRSQAVARFGEFQHLLAAPSVQKQLAVLCHGTTITPAKLCRIAIEAVRGNEDLLNCNRDSFLMAVYDCAKTGLMPDGVSGECALVPFKGKVQMIPMYQGLVKLVRNTGQINKIEAHLVHEKDAFDFSRGADKEDNWLQHKAAKGDRGKVTHVYAMAWWVDGTPTSFEVLSVDDIEAARQRSARPDGPAWKNDWGQMAKKTAMKRVVKHLPKQVAPIAQNLVNLEDKHEAEGKVIHYNPAEEDSYIIEEDQPNREQPKPSAGKPAGSSRLNQIADRESATQPKTATDGGKVIDGTASKVEDQPQAQEGGQKEPADSFGTIAMPRDGRKPDIVGWVAAFTKRLEDVPDTATLVSFLDANKSTLAGLEQIAADTFAEIKDKVDAVGKRLGKEVMG